MFTIKLNEKLEIPLALSNANVLCRKVITGMDWRVLEQADTKIRCKEVSLDNASFSWPAEVEIAMKLVAEDKTEVELKGTIFGFGEIQRSHLQEQLERIRERIELSVLERADLAHSRKPAAARHAEHETAKDFSLSGELEKLVSLFQQGVLTDEEFSKAKQRLLDKADTPL